MLFPTPELTPGDRGVLADIERMRDRLRDQFQHQPGRSVLRLRKFLTADAVAASNYIEGFRVSTQDVQDLMDGERDVDVSESLQTLMIAREGVLAPEFSSIEAWLRLTLQQAQRDLRDLVATGVLAPVGRTRARYYTEGPDFPAPALEVARTPFTLTSPYPYD